ncbi:MAG TPA: phosphate--acyl-ACP acyltransferase, partial [Ruminococcaceae bacterium]|nr:phosphate--acyl-ACP acyltransferase [Oscillospiraceae bacterium]
IDCGANVECRPEFLTQFGIMGSVYMNKAMQVENPTVGLLNIGTEESKGTELQKEAYKLLKDAPVNFAGNAEARDVPMGKFDVVVADGFSGNILLKATEGLGMAFGGLMKEIFTKNLKSKIAAKLVMDGIVNFKKKMDYSEYGGAPLLGFKRPVIKAHGSSGANAIKNAVRQAAAYASSGVTEEIEKRLSKNKGDENQGDEKKEE